MLNQQIDSLKAQLKTLGGDTGGLGDELDEAAGNADELSDGLDKAADSADDLKDEASKADDKLEDASTSAQGLDQNLSNARVAAVAMAAAVVAIGAAIIQATRSFFDFERAVTEVATLVDETKVSNAELSATVRELSSEFGQNTTSVAQGLYQTISSGAEAGEEANLLLRQSLLLAQGGFVDTSVAVDALTTAVNSFEQQGLTAEEASDILFATVRQGKTNMDELAASLAQVTPIASSVGVSFGEVNAAVATLTLGGVRTAQATTQIRAAIAGILRPTEELQKVFNDAGFASAQAALEQEGLKRAFDIVAQASGGQVGELQKLVGSIEGVQAIQLTTGPFATRFAEQIQSIGDAAGATQEAADKVAASFQQRFAEAINDVSIAFQTLGEALAPIVVILAEAFASVINVLGDFIRENQTLVQVITVVAGVVALIVAAFGTLIISVIAVRGAIAFLSGSAGFPLVTTALRAMGAQALSTAGSMTTLSRVMTLVGGGLSRLGSLFRGVIAAILSVNGALLTVTATLATFVVSTAFASEEVNKLADSFDQAAFQARVLASGSTIRSLGALEAEVRNIGDASRANVATLARDIALRKHQIELALEAARANLSTQEAADTLFNDNEDAIEGAKRQVELYEGQLKRVNTALNTTQSRLRVVNNEATRLASQGLADATKKAEALQKAFESAQEGTEAFFDDLQTLNEFKFDQLRNEVESQAELQKTLLEASGVDPSVLINTQLQTTQDVLALKEQEIAERIALEERRVARQSELIAQNVSDEVEAASQLQALSQSALQSQIRASTDLIGIRQEAVDSVRGQLASLVSASVETQATFEAAIREIDNKLREVNERGLTEAQRIQSAQTQISRLEANIRTAIANDELEDAKRIIEERQGLIDALSGQQQQTEAGFNLETQEAVSARDRDNLTSQRDLLGEINQIEQARNQAAQGEALEFLEREQQTLSEFKDELKELGSLSQVVNLQTNFVDVLDNLAEVQGALTKLKEEASAVQIRLAADQSVVNILSGQTAIQVDASGLQQIATIANQFGDAINLAATRLENASRALAQIQNFNQESGVISRAAGGAIRGPGTGTSDSILARLSNGEYVMRAAAVSKFGLGFFDRLNSLRLPSFAQGGAVGAIPLSQTTTDEVSISLNLNKQTFDLRSDRDTASRMVKAFEDLKTGLIGG